MPQYRVSATLQSTVDLRTIRAFYGPCENRADATQLLIAVAGRESCLEATIVEVPLSAKEKAKIAEKEKR